MHLVTWQDAAGGHHTGTVIPEALHRDDVSRLLSGVPSEDIDWRKFVRESCNGALTWVCDSQWEIYLARSERGEE